MEDATLPITNKTEILHKLANIEGGSVSFIAEITNTTSDPPWFTEMSSHSTINDFDDRSLPLFDVSGMCESILAGNPMCRSSPMLQTIQEDSPRTQTDSDGQKRVRKSRFGRRLSESQEISQCSSCPVDQHHWDVDPEPETPPPPPPPAEPDETEIDSYNDQELTTSDHGKETVDDGGDGSSSVSDSPPSETYKNDADLETLEPLPKLDGRSKSALEMRIESFFGYYQVEQPGRPGFYSGMAMMEWSQCEILPDHKYAFARLTRDIERIYTLEHAVLFYASAMQLWCQVEKNYELAKWAARLCETSAARVTTLASEKILELFKGLLRYTQAIDRETPEIQELVKIHNLFKDKKGDYLWNRITEVVDCALCGDIFRRELVSWSVSVVVKANDCLRSLIAYAQLNLEKFQQCTVVVMGREACLNPETKKLMAPLLSNELVFYLLTVPNDAGAPAVDNLTLLSFSGVCGLNTNMPFEEVLLKPKIPQIQICREKTKFR